MLEKYPRYFVLALAVYVMVLVIGLNFVFSGIAVGIATADFALLSLLIILPLLLMVPYVFSHRIIALWGRERMLRVIVTLLVLVDAVITVFVLLPASL